MSEGRLKPMFATPCYGGVVAWQFATSMVNLAETFRDAGVPFRTYMLGGESIVDRARNDCVAEFLESDCTDLFFVDADIQFQPQDALDMLTSGLDFVLAPYRKKQEREEWTTTLLEEDRRTGKVTLRKHPSDPAVHYIRCAEGGTGFLRLSRSAILRLAEGVPTYDGSRNGVPRRCPDLFRSVIDGDARIGEDQYLCRRWRSMGGVVWCSVDTRLGHVGVGSVTVFEGDFPRFIQLHRDRTIELGSTGHP